MKTLSRTQRLTVVWLVLGLGTFVVNLKHLTTMFARFEESSDFGTFFQASYQISRGHLNPYSTLFEYNYPHYGFPFYASHFELLLWVVSPLLRIFSSGLCLLVIGALAVSATQVLASVWITKLLQRYLTSALAMAALVIALIPLVYINPWYENALYFDFHMELLTMPLLLACGYAYYYGHWRVSTAFAVLVALGGDVQNTYLVALGIGLWLLDPKRNRSALLLSVGGLFMITMISAGHLNAASALVVRYGYLAGGATTTAALISGILTHPGVLLHTMISRFTIIQKFLTSAGFLGLINPLGFFVTAIVLLEPWIATDPSAFLSTFATFQDVSFQPFLTVGAAMASVFVLKRASRWLTGAWLGVIAITLIVSVQSAKTYLPVARAFNDTISSANARALHQALDLIPPRAEVIAANGVIGRFSGRPYVYPIVTVTAPLLPIWEHVTYILLTPGVGIEGVTVPQYEAVAQALSSPTRYPHVQRVYESGSIILFKLTSRNVGYEFNLLGPAA